MGLLTDVRRRRSVLIIASAASLSLISAYGLIYCGPALLREMMVARRIKEAREENPRDKQPRFGLRRGDQFEEALREGANQDTADEHWLSGLHAELEDEVTSTADARAQKQSSGWVVPPHGESRCQPASPVGSESQGEDLAMLAVELRRIRDRLRTAEEAMAEARSICAASSAVVERILSRPDQ